MKIIILHGSPKGEISVTMQYVQYLMQKFPEHDYEVFQIAQRIRKIESDPAEMERICASVAQADGVLWSFPLYFLTVHGHYKRFIELIHERGMQAAFAGKYAAALSTSIHFYDHTAHNYLRGVCEDLGMRFVDSFSADMNDLLKPSGQRQLSQFGEHWFTAMREQQPTQRLFAPLAPRDFTYTPGAQPTARPTGSQKVVILYDDRPESNAPRMAERCRQNFTGNVELFSLQEIDIKASCQGCLRCAGNNVCAYEGKDGLIDFYRQHIFPADVVVMVGAMVDRYLSARWKIFLERSFFNTHTPIMRDKQEVYIIAGPLSQNANLREMLEGYAEVQRAQVAAMVSDEYGDSAEVDALIDQAMRQALLGAQQAVSRPRTFLGVGGELLFRDEIWGRLRLVFAADYRAYRRLGLFNSFPQKDLKQRLLNTLVAPLLALNPIRERFNEQVKPQMIAPYRKALEQK